MDSPLPFDPLTVIEECTTGEIEVSVEEFQLSQDCKIKLGDKFQSYAEFQTVLKKYEQQTCVNYWVRDGKTLENQRKKYPNGTAARAKKELKYYSVKISCVKGGRNYTPRNKVRDTMTYRQGCSAGIFLKLSSCGQYLIVNQINESHNHDISPALFNTISKQRLDLSEEVKAEIKKACSMRSNKKILQNEIIAKTGCLITTKDLSNISAKPEREKKGFEDCVKLLQNVYNCTVEIHCDENGTLIGLYFQDQIMKDTFEAFGEIIFVDGTYCLIQGKCATYLIMVEDSNGNGCVVATGVLTVEDKAAIDWFVAAFKKFNPKAEGMIKIIMTDKDFTEKDVFKKHFPNANFIICLFHVFQIFNREITNKKMNITANECDIAKNLLQKLAYSSSEEKFNKIKTEIYKTCPQVVLDYFEKNWAHLTDEWILYKIYSNQSFLNKTNNRLENYNQKLKAVIQRYSRLEDFIKNFFVCVNSSRVNQNVNASKTLNKISTNYFSNNSAEAKYEKFLTPFAFKKLLDQLRKSSDSTRECVFVGENMYVVETSSGLVEVTADKCECLFFKSIGLPCSHIFRVRSLLELDLFEQKLCLHRWSRQYFLANSPYFKPDDDLSLEKSLEMTESSSRDNSIHQKPLTNHQKFKIMNSECLKLAKNCSEVSSNFFYEYLQKIKKMNQKISLQLPVSDSDSCSDLDLDEDIVQAEEINTNLPDHQYFDSCSNLDVDENRIQAEEIGTNLADHQYFHNSKGKNVDTGSFLQNVKMPIIKVRGRPKGFGNTVIGLKRKRLKKKLNKTDQKKQISEWLKKKQEKVVLGDIGNIIYTNKLPTNMLPTNMLPI